MLPLRSQKAQIFDFEFSIRNQCAGFRQCTLQNIVVKKMLLLLSERMGKGYFEVRVSDKTCSAHYFAINTHMDRHGLNTFRQVQTPLHYTHTNAKTKKASSVFTPSLPTVNV